MTEQIEFVSINAIPSESIQVISSFHISLDQTSGLPDFFVLDCALDDDKAHSGKVDFPIFIDAASIYKSYQHQLMLNTFKTGVPFVPVECEHFKCFRTKKEDGSLSYFGTASDFTIITNIDERLGDVL
jgi:hypothetical protein